MFKVRLMYPRDFKFYEGRLQHFLYPLQFDIDFHIDEDITLKGLSFVLTFLPAFNNANFTKNTGLKKMMSVSLM